MLTQRMMAVLTCPKAPSIPSYNVSNEGGIGIGISSI